MDKEFPLYFKYYCASKKEIMSTLQKSPALDFFVKTGLSSYFSLYFVQSRHENLFDCNTFHEGNNILPKNPEEQTWLSWRQVQGKPLQCPGPEQFPHPHQGSCSHSAGANQTHCLETKLPSLK